MAKTKEITKLPKALEAYLPLVHSIASMVSAKGLPPNIDYNDLVSDGTVGLMKAWENFDPKRGVKFETYASYRVRGEILDGFKNYNPVPYRVQVAIRDMVRGRYDTAVKAEDKKGERLMDKKELSEKEFKAAITRIKKIVSASALMYLLSLEGIAGESEVNVASEGTVAESFEFEELRNRLRNLMEKELDSVTQKVVHLFYFEGLNQKSIASRLRLSRSKVNRVLARAIDVLRKKIKEQEEAGLR